ncbi:hypothetical protein FOL47_010543 [Perkinsus chesapeaki]|uniref:Uncharacterized protein n=1 Tax=Perkinsus chesapeaki TaxID=330153 RepID=A0A7J6L2P3_PERCH|nr:hypothetical protein FOL47_010543 [Perkinsus chesapeaki]
MLSPRPINDEDETLRIKEGADTSAMINLQTSKSPVREPPLLNRNISVESRELSERISRAERNAEKNEALFRTENERVDVRRFDEDDSRDIRERKINFGNETTSYENLGDLESIAEEMGKPREVMIGRRPRSRSYIDLEVNY